MSPSVSVWPTIFSLCKETLLLPYTQDVLLGVVEFYQRQWGWLLLLFYPAFLLSIVWWRSARAELVTLALAWGTCGGLFFAMRFADYDFVARYEAAVFLLQALALALAAAIPRGKYPQAAHPWRRGLGKLLIWTGLLVLPLADALTFLWQGLGEASLWWSIRWPGLTPWTTTMLTLGVLLRRQGLWFLWFLPLLWAAKARVVAYWLDMPRDFLLPLAALLTVAVGLSVPRQTARSD